MSSGSADYVPPKTSARLIAIVVGLLIVTNRDHALRLLQLISAPPYGRLRPPCLCLAGPPAAPAPATPVLQPVSGFIVNDLRR